MNQKILQNLNNQEKLDNLKILIDDIIIFDMVDEAKKVIVELENIFLTNPDFKQADERLFKIFQNFLSSLKFVVIFELSEEDIFRLLDSSLEFVFKYPIYDLNRKIRYKISSLDSLEKRDAFKEKLRQTLLNNKTLLSSSKIIVSGIEQEPTVAAWLKDYYIRVGLEPIDALKFGEYMVNSPNTKNLSLEYQDKLKILLNIFEKTKVSSLKSPVFEESFVAVLPNSNIALISGGQPEIVNQETYKLARTSANINNIVIAKINQEDDDLFLPAKSPAVEKVDEYSLNLSELQQSLKNYPESSLEHKAISQEISRLKKSEFKQSQKADVN